MSIMPTPARAADSGGRSESMKPSPGTPDLLFQDSRSVSRALGHSVLGWNKVPAAGRWIANSHPKSGTHLLRNILLHFNSQSVHPNILFFNTFSEALNSDDVSRIFMGHIPYSVLQATPDAAGLESLLLLRHPCSIALALARAFYDVNSTRADHLYMREHDRFEQIVTQVVCGYECQGLHYDPLVKSLTEFSTSWLDAARIVVRFEDIITKIRGSDEELLAFFRPILEPVFEAMPADAALRIRAGSSSNISATYSRTKHSAHDLVKPQDVYSLLPTSIARDLLDVVTLLGY